MRTSTGTLGPRHWLRPVLLSLFLVMQAGWLGAWSVSLGSWIDANAHGPIVGITPLVGLLILAALLSRAATTRWRASRGARLVVALLGLAFAVLAGISVARTASGTADWQETWRLFGQTGLGMRSSSAAALALLAWWRGIAAGRNRLSLDEVETGFRGATIALIAAFVIDLLAATQTATNGLLIAAAAVVLFAGLIALPLARVVDLTERSRRRETPSLGVRGHWLAILVGTVTVLLVTAYVLAEVFTFQRIDDLTRPLAGPADSLLWAILYLIAVPTGYLIEAILYLLRLFLHPSAAHQALQPPQIDWLGKLRAEAHGGSGPPALLIATLKGAVITVLGAIVVWLLVRAIFRFAEWRSDDDVEETRDFIVSWAELREALRQALRSLRRLPTRRRAPVPAGQPVVPITDRRLWGPRELYRELLRLGTRHGRARARAETPHEYQRALSEISPFDTGKREITLLTGVYVQARYGDNPPDALAVAGAREALDQLQGLIEPDRAQKPARHESCATTLTRHDGGPTTPHALTGH